jgi:hypothetical protein
LFHKTCSGPDWNTRPACAGGLGTGGVGGGLFYGTGYYGGGLGLVTIIRIVLPLMGRI